MRGDEDVVKRAFYDDFMILRCRIALLMNLPIEKLARLALQGELVNGSAANLSQCPVNEE